VVDLHEAAIKKAMPQRMAIRRILDNMVFVVLEVQRKYPGECVYKKHQSPVSGNLKNCVEVFEIACRYLFSDGFYGVA
jgi:hypothetical protein